MKVWKCLAAGVLCGPVVMAQQVPPASQSTSSGSGQVIFSRSADSEAQKPAPAKQPLIDAKATDAERSAITFTAYDLDMHLAQREHSLEVQARITVRNDSDQPLKQLPLQLSSSLSFEEVALDGKRLSLGLQTLNSDADHTGQLHEAVVVLPQALAPKASLKLQVVYGGQIPVSAKRLLQIGTPGDVAEASDWDRVSDEFVGLRGFGNVVWYPVNSIPVALGDGAKVFAAIGQQKLRQSDAMVSLRVTEEFWGNPPNAALLDGHFIDCSKPSAMPSDLYPGVVTCSLPSTWLGFAAPSIILAERVKSEGSGMRVFSKEQDQVNAQSYITAGSMVQLLAQQWLGTKTRELLTIIQLPEKDDASAELGSAMLVGLGSAQPQQLATGISHGLAHAAFSSPREWLNEGVANFLATLWIEQSSGRTAALERLEAERNALALAEPGTPGEGAGQDLIHASDAIYYREKATYVLWMLRDIAGDKALQQALAAYDPAADTSLEYFEHLVEKASGKDLKWFFDDWVYRDRGLPDLSITSVYSTTAGPGQVLVAIDIANDGYIECEIPVTVRWAAGSLTERVRVPAHNKVVHRMPVQGQPDEVTLNDGTVPEVQASIHKRTITSGGGN